MTRPKSCTTLKLVEESQMNNYVVPKSIPTTISPEAMATDLEYEMNESAEDGASDQPTDSLVLPKAVSAMGQIRHDHHELATSLRTPPQSILALGQANPPTCLKQRLTSCSLLELVIPVDWTLLQHGSIRLSYARVHGHFCTEGVHEDCAPAPAVIHPSDWLPLR